MASWQISGQYMETCNCTFVCPCITSNLAGRPTEGDCKAAVAMRIDKGTKDGVTLDGVAFVLMLQSPGPMAEGNLTVGLIVDQRATDPQVEAIKAITGGAAGGPMAALAPLVGRMAGVERRPIRFEGEGLKWSMSAGDMVDQACEGVASAINPQEPIYLDNTAHPVSSRVPLARATRSAFNAFGMRWNDDTGNRNAHYAPFAWNG